MRPLKNIEISGNWATLLLPIDKDDSINFRKLEKEIDLLISFNVNGIYSNGTAGEFYTQTESEFDRVNELLASKCNASGMPFQIGCSHTSPQISLARLKKAVILEPSAIQVILPDWFPPTITEIIDYLKVMAEAAAPVNLILYNPPHAKVRLKPEDFYSIVNAGIPIAGCKVAGGDEQWYASMKRLVPNLSLFVPGHKLATGYTLGAHGAYSNVACLNPLVAQKWYNSMLTDINSALELEKRIQIFMNRCIIPYIEKQGFSNQAVDKFLAATGNWTDINTRMRWPYRSIDQSEVKKSRLICKEIIPEFMPF